MSRSDHETLRTFQHQILDRLRPIGFLSTPFVVSFAVVAIARHGPSIWLALQIAGALGVGAAMLRRISYRTRASLLVASVTSISLGGFFHYGPLVGVGVLFTMSALAAAFFWSRAATLAVVALFVAAVLSGPLVADTLQPAVHPDAWPRMALTVGLALLVATLLFIQLQRLTHSVLEARAAALAQREVVERDRERVLRSALSSQRLESLGRLAGGVAHDFNNSLLVILGGAEALARPDTPAAEREEIVREIRSAAVAASGTTRQLLAFSRGAPDAGGVCSPSALLQRLASGLRRLLPEDIRVVVDARGAGLAALSEAALEQALLNLVLNARDAMPSGGTLTLRCFDDGEHVRLEVEDDGVGMSEEVRARLFEPFFTTKGERGTGLGLAMTWGTLTRAGGTIEVHSAPGAGARFEVALPRAAEPPRAPGAPAAGPAVAKEHLLLLEDDPDVRRTMERMLRRAGFAVSGHERADDARRALAEGSFDMLVTDAVVPGGGVPELIRAFRARHADAPVLVCSGHVEEELVLEGIARDELGFLGKPFSSQTLLDAIERARGRAVSSRPR
jgi:signal transduction histidine kinase/ActR/RegA family two-component response regulator